MAYLTCSQICMKYLLFIFNFVFWLAGTVLFAVALWLRFNSKTKSFFEGELSASLFLTGVHILIVAGALTMALGFLGCCGAVRESPSTLGLFFFILIIIFILEVSSGIWAIANSEKVLQNVERFYNETYYEHLSKKTGILTKTINLIHNTLHCCGPKKHSPTCPKKEGASQKVKRSCYPAIRSLFKDKLEIIALVGLSLGLLTIFGLVSSMVLIYTIRRHRM
nr:CD9 antigen-like isoform X2 [Paramormyrops kingsleyae]